MNVCNWLYMRQLEGKLTAYLHQGVGQHHKCWMTDDPEAELKFFQWMEGRHRMARRPIPETLVQLRLISVPAAAMQKAKEGATEIEGNMAEQGIDFPWDEFTDLHETFQGMFRKARAVPDTEMILGLLVDTGDLVERSLRDVEREADKRRK
jgi:hypothetical protein